MIPVIIWLLSYNTYRTHGYDTVFCTDLVPPGLSIELLDNSLFMLGGDENTVEMLVSDKTSKHFAKLLSSSCLTEETKNPSCYSKMRRSFLDEYESYSTEFSNFTNGTLKLIDDYQDRTKSSWNKMSKRFFTISCLIMCWTAHRETDDKHYKMMCPNPCHSQKICPFKDCERLGVFEHQYKCKCAEGSEWDYETHACLSKDLLALRNRQSVNEIAQQTVPCNCDAKGTEYCTSDSSEAKFACHCKPQYTGELCADPVDACKHRIQNPYLVNGGLLAAGDRACNVNQEGNSCFSFISSDGDVQYKCKCDSRKWSPDPRLPYDNCLKRRSLCDSIVCIHGRCVSNEMGTQSLCICRPGYTGRMCSEWVGEWSEWSPWDKCRPACGDFRLAVRSRDCKSMQDEVVMKRECVGAAIEYAQCSEHPCARTEGTFVNTYFAVRQNGIASSLSTAAVVCALITIIWALFFWTTISKPLLSIIIQLTRRSSTGQ